MKFIDESTLPFAGVTTTGRLHGSINTLRVVIVIPVVPTGGISHIVRE